MKNLFRILIAGTVIFMFYYFVTSSNESVKPLEGSNPKNHAIPKTELEEDVGEYLPRPTKGLSTYIGKSSEELKEEYGVPSYIELSNYGYDWWIYEIDQRFIMFGIENEKVHQIYTNSAEYDVSPYAIGQSLDEIYRMSILTEEIAVKVEDNTYLFMMNEEDVQSRILIGFEGLFAQLYIDKESKQLAGIRYMDGETLIKHRPYEFQYIGELIQPDVPSSFEQKQIDEAHADQIFYLVNQYRLKNNVSPLMRSSILNQVATSYSENLYLQSMETASNFEQFSVKTELKNINFHYKSLGENLARNYLDSIEVFHAWINSEEHKKEMLNEKYTMTGTGVFLNSYSQLFVEDERE